MEPYQMIMDKIEKTPENFEEMMAVVEEVCSSRVRRQAGHQQDGVGVGTAPVWHTAGRRRAGSARR